jgi:hypothetical protein
VCGIENLGFRFSSMPLPSCLNVFFMKCIVRCVDTFQHNK